MFIKIVISLGSQNWTHKFKVEIDPHKGSMADILLLNATVATLNKRREIFKDGAVAI